MPDSILILYASIPKNIPDDAWNRSMSRLPLFLREKTMRYRSEHRRRAHLLGKLLLREGLLRFGSPSTLADLRLTPQEKPYFENGPYFSISHSGEYVICALSQAGECGIDIERHRDGRPADFRPWFTAEEVNQIELSPDPSRELIRLWTLREALFKAAGPEAEDAELKPMANPYTRAIIGDKTWYLQSVEISDDYCASLAAERPNPQIELRELRF